MPTQTRDFWKLFKPSACSLRLRGTTQREVFEEIVANLNSAKLLPEELMEFALEALEAREKLASTGIGKSVAIPHVQISGLEEVVVSLSVHPEGVDWNALDGEVSHLFFLVLRPAGKSDRHDPELHLEMMKWISVLSRDPDFRSFARASKTRTDLVGLLKEMARLGS